MSTVTTPAELRLAKRMARLGTETAFETLAKARALEAQGRSIIHLEIGEPDFDTPANVIEAGIEAIHKGFTHYTPSAGMPALREAVAEEVTVQTDCAELAAQSDRQRGDRAGCEGHCRRDRRSRHHGALRRDLQQTDL
jgi:hypothetical protein